MDVATGAAYGLCMGYLYVLGERGWIVRVVRDLSSDLRSRKHPKQVLRS